MSIDSGLAVALTADDTQKVMDKFPAILTALIRGVRHVEELERAHATAVSDLKEVRRSLTECQTVLGNEMIEHSQLREQYQLVADDLAVSRETIATLRGNVTETTNHSLAYQKQVSELMLKVTECLDNLDTLRKQSEERSATLRDLQAFSQSRTSALREIALAMGMDPASDPSQVMGAATELVAAHHRAVKGRKEPRSYMEKLFGPTR